MQRLAQFDISRQFLTRGGKVAAQIGFGLVCGVAMVGLRTMLDVWAPETGPFALVYPTVLLATLYGHWRAGLCAFLLSFLWAWYIVLPSPYSFTFTDPSDASRVVINALSVLVLLFFAEVFRAAAQRTMDEIRAAADRRLTLLSELEHRTKNNFSLVASLLEIQKRTLARPDLDGPLDDAVNRVRTFADAYSSLAMDQEEDVEVAMKPYLDLLLDRIERAALADNVTLHREIENISLPREKGVAIGLYLNEALANCAKYAFAEGAPGTIAVAFNVTDGAWRLSIEDDGLGSAAVTTGSTGLGRNLMDAFAAQARAVHVGGPRDRGFRVELASS